MRDAQPHGGNGGLDRVRRTDMMPVFGREVVGGEQGFIVFLEALSRLRVFWHIGREEGLERLGSVFTRRRHPNLMERALGMRLRVLRQFIQHVHRLMYPAALGAGDSKHLGQVTCALNVAP